MTRGHKSCAKMPSLTIHLKSAGRNWRTFMSDFVYLGSKMTTEGNCDQDINIRISKANQVFAMLKPFGYLLFLTFISRWRSSQCLQQPSGWIRELEDNHHHWRKAVGLPAQVLQEHPQNFRPGTVSEKTCETGDGCVPWNRRAKHSTVHNLDMFAVCHQYVQAL